MALSKWPNLLLRRNVSIRNAFFRSFHKEVDDGIPVEDYVDYKPSPKPRIPKYNISPEYLKNRKTGNFEIDELVSFLREQNLQELFVCKVSPKLRYVDFMVVGSGLSNRHNIRIAEAVRYLFKKKSHDAKDASLEGLKLKNDGKWIAMDLGNIALHIMNNDSREYYDLETLWAAGPELADFNDFMNP